MQRITPKTLCVNHAENLKFADGFKWCETHCTRCPKIEEPEPKREFIIIERTEKRLLCVETGGIFATAKALRTLSGCSLDKIQHAVKTGCEAYGMTWRYITPAPGQHSPEKRDETLKRIYDYRHQNRAKKVLCHQNQVTYDSCKQAADKLGLISKLVSAVALKNRNHTNGYTFEYVEETK